jgi:CBS domain-containing protein
MSPRAAGRLEAMGFREVYDYAPGKADWGAAGLPLEGTLAQQPRIGELTIAVPTCRLDEPVGEVMQRAQEKGWGIAVAVNDAGIVLGVLRKRALESDASAPVESAMAPGPSTFRPNVAAHDMLHHMMDRDIQGALVTKADGSLMGMVRRHDLEQALREAAEPGQRTSGYAVKGW